MTTRSIGLPPPPPAASVSVPDSRAAPSRTSAPETLTRRGVMDTLLGENNLSAYDASGNDPYNATGKSFRR